MSGANTILNLMKKTSSNNNTISELVSVRVKSTSPLILNLDNRIDLTADFFVLSKTIIVDRLKIGDVLTAITLNDRQKYYVMESDSVITSQVINSLSSDSIIDSLSANQGRILYNEITKLNSIIENHEQRIKKLENYLNL